MRGEYDSIQGSSKVVGNLADNQATEVRLLPPGLTLEEALHDLAECYRLSGADPDGNEDWRLAPYAVEAVRELREDYDRLLNDYAD